MTMAKMAIADRLNPEVKHPKYSYLCKECNSYHMTRKKNKVLTNQKVKFNSFLGSI